jgi:hypothetical protein
MGEYTHAMSWITVNPSRSSFVAQQFRILGSDRVSPGDRSHIAGKVSFEP